MSGSGVRRASIEDLDTAAALFERYRTDFGQAPSPARSRDFLAERLSRNQSVLLLAEGDAGFVQLYPTWSSVRLARVWVLNDLYVLPTQRRRGLARALLDAAAAFARDDGALRLELDTTPDNDAAQALYLAAGWHRFDGSLQFRLPLHTTVV